MFRFPYRVWAEVPSSRLQAAEGLRLASLNQSEPVPPPLQCQAQATVEPLFVKHKCCLISSHSTGCTTQLA